MTAPSCAAAGTCRRPAAHILINDCGATALCDRHDTLAVAIAMQHQPDERSRCIVIPVAEVAT